MQFAYTNVMVSRSNTIRKINDLIDDLNRLHAAVMASLLCGLAGFAGLLFY